MDKHQTIADRPASSMDVKDMGLGIFLLIPPLRAGDVTDNW
jgi:hypothetical protein